MSSSSSSSATSKGSGSVESSSFGFDIISISNIYKLKPLPIKIKEKKLTQQGLDMCTEVLGSENMAKNFHDSYINAVVDHDHGNNYNEQKKNKIKEKLWTSRIAPKMSLPPPMRSLVEENVAVRVTREVEDGNFVLKATINRPPPSSPSTFLVAERIAGNGAETTRLVMKYQYYFKPSDQTHQGVEEEEEYFDVEEKDEKNDYSESVVMEEIVELKKKMVADCDYSHCGELVMVP